MTAMQAALALALLALLAPGMPAATSARRLLDSGAHALNWREQSWMLVQAQLAGQLHAAKQVLDSHLSAVLKDGLPRICVGKGGACKPRRSKGTDC